MNQAQLQDFLKNKTYGTPPEEEQDVPLEPPVEEVSPLEPPVKPTVSPERLPPRDRAREWSDSPQFPHGGRYRAGAVSPYGHELGADIDSSEQDRYSQSLAELTKSDDSDWDQRMVASFRESWDTRKQMTSAWDEVFALPGLVAPTRGLFLDKIIKGEDEPLRIGFPNARDMIQLLGEAQIALGMESENGLLSGAPLGMILPLGARANRALGGGDFFGDETPMWDTAVQFYRERYDFTQPGWAEAFGEVLATDMAGVIGDFAAAASLAGLSAKGVSVASKAAARASRQLGIKMDGRLAKAGWVSEKLASKAEKFGELAEGFNRRMNQSMVSPEQLFSIAKAPGVLRALGRFGRRWGAADMELATLPFVAAAELWRMKLKRAGEVPIDVGLQDLMLSQRKLEGVEMQMRADEPPNVEQLSPDELRDELASVRQESDSIREQLEVIEDDTIAGELRNTLAGLDERRNQINARLTNPVTDEVVQDIETTVVEAGEQIEQARDTVDIDANTTEYSNRMIEILEGLGRNIDEQGQQVIEQAIQEARGTGQVSDESLFQIGRLGESLTVEVVDAIRQAFESEGRPTEWLDNLSIHAYGDIQRGLEESARLGEVDPDSAFPPTHQAYSYERLQQWDDMEQAARQAVEKDSTDVYAQAALGRALTHKGQFDEAIEVFDNLITNNPDDAYAHISRAETKRKMGDTEGADADIERAEEIQFGDPSEDTMSVDDARREFGEKAEADERELTAEAATFRGLNHFKAGRYSQAIARAEEAVRLDPNNVLAHGILGYSYYGKGRASRRTGNMEESNTFFEDAANSFRKALEIEPDNVYSLNGMAWYHYRKGQHSQARYYREQARLAESGERMAGRGVAEIESELAEVRSTLQDLDNRVTALEDSSDVEQLRTQADNLESELAEARSREDGEIDDAESDRADTEDALTLLDEAEITIELNDEGQKVAKYQGLDEDGNPHEVTTTFDADIPDSEVRQRTQELIDAEKELYQRQLDKGDEAPDDSPTYDVSNDPRFTNNPPELQDEGGNPIIVYHGSRNLEGVISSGQFDPALRGEATGAQSAEHGFFFTDNQGMAQTYAEPPWSLGRLDSEIADQERIISGNLTIDSDTFLVRNEAGSPVQRFSSAEEAQAFIDSLRTRAQARIDHLTQYREDVISRVLETEQTRGVGKFHLLMENPLVISKEDLGSQYDTSITNAIKAAQQQGHDGVVIKGMQDIVQRPDLPGDATNTQRKQAMDDITGIVYIVFRSEQIVDANTGRLMANRESWLGRNVSSLHDNLLQDDLDQANQQIEEFRNQLEQITDENQLSNTQNIISELESYRDEIQAEFQRRQEEGGETPEQQVQDAEAQVEQTGNAVAEAEMALRQHRQQTENRSDVERGMRATEALGEAEELSDRLQKFANGLRADVIQIRRGGDEVNLQAVQAQLPELRSIVNRVVNRLTESEADLPNWVMEDVADIRSEITEALSLVERTVTDSEFGNLLNSVDDLLARMGERGGQRTETDRQPEASAEDLAREQELTANLEEVRQRHEDALTQDSEARQAMGEARESAMSPEERQLANRLNELEQEFYRLEQAGEDTESINTETEQVQQSLADLRNTNDDIPFGEDDTARPPDTEEPPDAETVRQPSQLPLNQVEEFYQFLLDKAKDVDDPMLNEYVQALDGLTEDIVQGLAEIDPRIEGITDAFEDAKQIVGNKATFDYLDFIRNTLGNDVTDAPRYSNVVNQLMENIDSPENVQRILEQLSENDIDRFRGVVLQNMWERWADGGADDLAKLNENGQLEALLGTGIANSIRMWDEIVEDYIRPDPRPETAPDPRPETAPDRPPEPETVADENLPRTPEGELPRRPEDILPEDKLLPHEEVAEHRLNIKRRRKAIVEAARSRIIEMLASIRNSFVYRASLGISAGIVGLGAYQGAGWLIAGGAFALVNAAALEVIVYIADKRNLRKSIREGVPHVEDAIQRGKGEPAIINLLDAMLDDAKRQNILPSLRILKESSQIREDDERLDAPAFGEFAR